MSPRVLVAVASIALALPAFAQKPAAPPAQAATATQPSTGGQTAPADPWAGRTDLFKLPTIVPSTKVTLGTVQRFTLPNGLQVLAVPRPQLPAVDITLVINAGNGSTPVEKSGLAAFAASMLRKGTDKRSADQIAEAIDFVGGELDGSADDDGTFVSCHVRSKDLPLCLDLLSDVVLHPTFPEAEMGEIRDQMLSGVEGAKDNPQALAGEHGANLFFGDDDPRGRPVSRRSLSLIDRAGLVDFYKTWYAPNNALAVISGDFDAKQVRAQLTKFFGAWKKKPVPKRLARTLPKPSAQVAVRLVDKPDATQSAIVVLGPGIKHADKDFAAVQLMNFTLGAGGFSSRLMKVVRSEGGKTYGARSGFEARREPGPFTATTFTRTPETGATLELVLNEIKRMRETGPTDDELASAKGNLIGGYGLRLETGSDVARRLLVAQLDGLPADFVVKYPQLLSTTTRAQATKAAADHLMPTSLVVVGNAAEVKPQLEKLGFKDIDVVSYTDPVSTAERKLAAVEKQKESEAGSPEEVAAGQKLLAVALAAKGGPKLRDIKDLQLAGKGTMSVQGQKLPITVTEYYLPGKAARQDIAVGAGTVTQVLQPDGHAFMRQGQQVIDLPAQAATQLKHDLFRDPNFVLLYASASGAKVRAFTPPEGKLDGLTVVSPDGDATKLYLDPASHLIVRMAYASDGKNATDELGDYRPEGGIQMPHHVLHAGEGQTIEVSYDKVKINAGLPPDAFKK